MNSYCGSVMLLLQNIGGWWLLLLLLLLLTGRGIEQWKIFLQPWFLVFVVFCVYLFKGAAPGKQQQTSRESKDPVSGGIRGRMLPLMYGRI